MTGKCISIPKNACVKHVKHYNYTLGDSTLQETDSHPYLGVCITKDLTWNKHIHQITASANHTLAFVRRNLHSYPKNIKTTAYTTLVRTLLEYSSSVWDPHTQVLINKIEMVQRRAAHFCHNDYTSRETGCVSEMITPRATNNQENKQTAYHISQSHPQSSIIACRKPPPTHQTPLTASK